MRVVGVDPQRLADDHRAQVVRPGDRRHHRGRARRRRRCRPGQVHLAGRNSGCDPAPDADRGGADLRRGAAGPGARGALEHSGTPAILANRPGGSVAVMLDSSWSAVLDRENVSVNGENAPADRVRGAGRERRGERRRGAAAGDVERRRSGSRRRPAALRRAQMSEVVVNVPQVSGLASAASGPPNRFRFRSLNGSCGLLLNTVGQLPGASGSALTWPDRLMVTLSAGSRRRTAGTSVSPNRRADVDRARELVGQQRRLDRHRPDLRRVRTAAGRELGVRAALQPVGHRRRQRGAGRQRHRHVLHRRRREAYGCSFWGTFRSTS